MTSPSRVLCAPWVSLPDLPDDRPRLPSKTSSDEANDDAWEAIAWQASEILYALTARQFTGSCESTVELREHRPRHRGYVADAVFGGPAGAEAASNPAGLPARAWGHRGALVAALPGRPVTELLEVTIDGEDVAVEADLAAGLLWRADGWPWPWDGSALVTYKHGVNPPTGGVQAAKLLALELAKAHVGDASCALPQRVQTLTRQGVTVGFRDTFESLDKNRTGLWPVDAFIQSVNPAKLTAPSSVYSPDAIRGRRKVIP